MNTDPATLLKVFSTVFVTVFLAELADKTQLATMLFSAQAQVSRWWIFAAASLALVAACALGVLAGSVITRLVTEKQMNLVAGVLFILLGAYTIWRSQA